MERDSNLEEAIPVFSPALEAALCEVVSSDKLDSPNFNPIDYINETFPKESSLGDNQLNEFLGKLRHRVVTVSDNITKDVREFSTQRTRTKNAIDSATDAIGDLFTKIKAIKEKAAKSEEMVEKICRDIKSLDYAKRHLTNTILAMRNLHMLVSAVEQLELIVSEKQYRDVAQMLRAINDLLTLFVEYKDVKNIKDLQLKVDGLKENIKSQIFEDYNSLMPNLKALALPTNQKTLNEACLVVDAFEPQVRKELLNSFTRSRLGSYIQLFAVGNQGATLDQTDRRYGWLRSELERYEQHFQPIFPESWDTPAILSYEFCTLTRGHLADILSAEEEKFEINALLRALQCTLAFERELLARFRGTNLSDHYEKGDDDIRGQGNLIRAKYTRMQKGTDHQSNLCFSRLISDAFTPYMGRYVELERSNIKELIDRIEEDEKWEPDPIDFDDISRFMGSDELFLYIKKSIKRCSRLTKGIVLFQLFEEYQRGLSLYVDLLSSKIPRGELIKGGAEPESLELSHLQIISTCLILNTAEYCNDTIPALEESIKKHIDEEFNEKIVLTTTQEQFFALINKSAAVIVQSTMKKMDRTLTDMSKKQWATWEEVGDHSDYVNEIKRILKEDVPIVAQKLSSLYHNYYCTQLVHAFIPKYIAAIHNCKRIGEMGGQQLALDAHALKHCLLDIPDIGKSSQNDQDDAKQSRAQRKKKRAQRLFKEYVKREMGKAEALLKILVSPTDQLIHTWKALLPKSTLEELARIMNLRGVKKADQQSCVEEYNSMVGAEEKIDIRAWKEVLAEAEPSTRFKQLIKMSANFSATTYGANSMK